MQQMREAFPWDHACRYLLRDRDAIYGGDLVAMTKDLGMEEVISAPRSPWQNPRYGPTDANRPSRKLALSVRPFLGFEISARKSVRVMAISYQL
jgi:hypothetical protein